MRSLASSSRPCSRARPQAIRGWALALLLAPCAGADTRIHQVEPGLREVLRETIVDSASFADRFDAEVWLFAMSRRLQNTLPDDALRLRLLRLVHQEATRAGLDPELVLAVIQVESNFDRYALSHAGAQGLMQVMPFWLEEIGQPHANLFDPAVNLRFGCTILNYYLERENGNLERALARYNGSLGSRAYSDKVLGSLRKHWMAP